MGMYQCAFKSARKEQIPMCIVLLVDAIFLLLFGALSVLMVVSIFGLWTSARNANNTREQSASFVIMPPTTVFVFRCSIVDLVLWIQDLISCCRSPQEQALPKNIAMQQLVGKRAKKGELYVEQLSSVAVQVSVCTCVCV